MNAAHTDDSGTDHSITDDSVTDHSITDDSVTDSDDVGTGSGRAPLVGLRVVVTRAAEHQRAFVDLLETAGATVVELPLVATVDVADDRTLAALIGALGPDDWVVVSSMHAARRAARHLDGTVARVAAVGATTATQLPRVDLVATRQSAAGLVERFPRRPGESPGRVIVAQAVDGTSTLVDGIAARGWDVIRVDTHRTLPVHPEPALRDAALGADVVVFTAGSQARAWVAAFGADRPRSVAVIGPQTAADTEAAGLKVDLVAADHSLPGLVRALRETPREN
jgi:uroporphyrinogen-III synthase